MMATGRGMSRLSDAISPYLLAHAQQSVDWFPWGVEAFAEALRRDVPVMISIGYRTCHWCHVMSRESFDNPATAALLNERMVCIKVDREEHLDVDATYMAQAQAFTQNLGWPLTIFATPEGKTFYAATYLPPEPRDGLPSFTQVIDAASAAWNSNRDEVLESSQALVEALTEATAAIDSDHRPLPTATQLDAVVQDIAAREDLTYGGLGGAPKFPLAPVVNFLLGRQSRGDAGAGELATRLLGAYAGSPLRDSVEGGFFRYSTKDDFSDPHYERMLYDNAGLLMAYSRAGMLDVAEGIVSFFRHQLFTGGALGSAQDSESMIDGVSSEGGYYQRSASERADLQGPALDDKIVTAWNGLALEALAYAHRVGVGGEPGKLGAEMATWLLAHHVKEGVLVRVSRAKRDSDAPATMEDYGGLALGLLELGLALGRADFFTHAKKLVDHVVGSSKSLRGDPVLEAHGMGQASDISEGASPSGISLVAMSLIRVAALTGQGSYREHAREIVSPYVAASLVHPLGLGGVLRVLSELDAVSREVIVVANEPSELAEIAKGFIHEGGVSLAVTSAQATEFVEAGCELLEGRTDAPTPVAYVCEQGVCHLPLGDADLLRRALRIAPPGAVQSGAA